jgi:hypothetical protein
MMLRDVVATQFADRELHEPGANTTNSDRG